MINLTTSSIKGITNSSIAKSERGDCFVRALAAATDQDYDTAHFVAKTKFGRENRKGTQGLAIKTAFLAAEEKGLEINNIVYDVKVMSKSQLTNRYKLKGEIYNRKKTVKSFIKSYPKGSYIVTVSGHALCVKDGKLIDNVGEEFRPTRKVDGAYRISNNRVSNQLQLF